VAPHRIAVSGETACVLRDRRPVCWGSNSSGELGIPPVNADPEFDFVSTPMQVESSPELTHIFGYNRVFCGITEARLLWCWGNVHGISGRAEPQEIPIADVHDVAIGFSHICALRTDGAVFCFGRGGESVTGMAGAVTTHVMPQHLQGFDGSVAIFALMGSTCASVSGALRCVGEAKLSVKGELGGSAIGGADVLDIKAGREHACALLRNNRVRCWGEAEDGRLGRRNPGAGTNLPRWNELTLDRLTGLAVGHFHSCAVREDGSVWCWGENLAGQIGDGTHGGGADDYMRAEPVRVNIGPAVELAADGHSTCALLRDDSVWCWGGNSAGQLGTGGDDPVLEPTPVRVVFPD
jgi:alpha-tubulin suppressor-like RCC1 family protein